ncbi:MAG: glutamate 5-kinase, partial [Rikenellaceae bacterium]|nr:glutamate 5-kinase [Rikenellaceae bacterium]
GSNVLTRTDGTLDTTRMSSLVDQIAALYRSGIEVIVVSSGAVASGRSEMKRYEQRGASGGHENASAKTRGGAKLDAVSARQLFSAVGQVKLINRYYNLFEERDILCGQVLTTKESLATRGHYLNQRNCMETMLQRGVIPIVNENDTISVTELMFTDNDELSGLVSTMMGADALIILSNIDGIFDGDPSQSGTSVIREIHPGKRDLSHYIQATRSEFGRGGMLTKSRIAARVADEGVEVIIANGKKDNMLTAITGTGASATKQDVLCTRFVPSPREVSSLKKWIAHSEGFAKGALHINQGAYDALLREKAISLLPVGVCAVDGEFEKDDIVRILAPDGAQIGLGRVSADSARARQVAGQKGARALVHYDYLYLDV